MDSKIILKSSSKIPLSQRFSKIQSRTGDRPTSTTSHRDKIGGGKSFNPLSVTLKRGTTSSRKAMGNQGSAKFRVGDKQRLGHETTLRKRTTPIVKTEFQNYAVEYRQPRQGSTRAGVASGRFQRGGYKGVQTNPPFKNNNPIQATWNKPFVKRPQPSPKKEDLDKDLEKYMSRSKGYLDDQLDEYHKQV